MIALAEGELDSIPGVSEGTISAITLCELQHGLRVADESELLSRASTLSFVESTLEVLPIDATVAPHFGRLMATARRVRGKRIGDANALIAATAAAHGLPLYTRDRDFDGIEGPPEIVHA